jgi:hypothetical protein
MTRLVYITERSYPVSEGLWEIVVVAVTIHWMAAPVAVIAHKDEPLDLTGRYTSGIG